MWEEVGRVSAGSCSGAQVSLELRLLLPQAPEYWIYRHEAKDGKSASHWAFLSCFTLTSTFSQHQASNRSH